MRCSSEFRTVLDKAVNRGWVITDKPGGHLQMRHPGGGLSHVSKTPGDCRAVARVDTTLRRLERNPNVRGDAR